MKINRPIPSKGGQEMFVLPSNAQDYNGIAQLIQIYHTILSDPKKLFPQLDISTTLALVTKFFSIDLLSVTKINAHIPEVPKTRLSLATTILVCCLCLSSLSYGQDVNIPTPARDITSDEVLVRGSDGTIRASKYEVGDFAHGGIVFYVDETGQHGLVCNLWNITGNSQWTPNNKRTGALASGINGGAPNTSIIIAAHVGDPYLSSAAFIANQYTIEYQNKILSGWYLPSGIELQELFSVYTTINSAINALPESVFPVPMLDKELRPDAAYWSSTEGSDAAAQFYLHTPSPQLTTDSKSTRKWVRAIRQF
ncbi:MAG: hypothetical protein AAFQ02_00720 [Bacteroidota bacterium]